MKFDNFLTDREIKQKRVIYARLSSISLLLFIFLIFALVYMSINEIASTYYFIGLLCAFFIYTIAEGNKADFDEIDTPSYTKMNNYVASCEDIATYVNRALSSRGYIIQKEYDLIHSHYLSVKFRSELVSVKQNLIANIEKTIS